MNPTREVMFRGKQVSNGQWAYGYYVSLAYLPENTIEHCIVTFPGSPENYHEVFANTVGQYTGRTDKAGTRAYEHDCIRELYGDAIGVICYGENNYAFDCYGSPDCIR